jgi:hypothetical protein
VRRWRGLADSESAEAERPDDRQLERRDRERVAGGE